MLFTYPEPTDTENWFHCCLGSMLKQVHDLVRDNKPLPPWPDIVPVAHQPDLRRKSSIENAIVAYDKALRRLGQPNREKIYKAFGEQNNIESLLANTSNCEVIDALPKPIRNPVSNLFDAAFRLLTTLSIRDKHYVYICKGIPDYVCPFCGFEPLDGPGGPSEPMDHYLASSIYPFAGANLKNLPFMGNKCNSRHKLNIDIIRIAGPRRTAFYPYHKHELKLDLTKSVPFGGDDGVKPKWVIDFSPHSPEVDTWLEVFHVRDRYVKDVLDLCYIQWIRQFQTTCKRKAVDLSTQPSLLAALDEYALDHEVLGIGDRNFIRAAVFRMFHAHCSAGDTNLIQFLQKLLP